MGPIHQNTCGAQINGEIQRYQIANYLWSSIYGEIQRHQLTNYLWSSICGEAQRSTDLLKRILIHQKVVNQSTKNNCGAQLTEKSNGVNLPNCLWSSIDGEIQWHQLTNYLWSSIWGEAQRSADQLKRILIHQKVVNQSTKINCGAQLTEKSNGVSLPN